MEVIQSILAFLVAIFILVSLHEWGHFIVARIFNVKVIKFSIGMGRELISFFDKKGTKFALSALPIGGYVQLLGEQELKDIPKEEWKYSFVKKHPLKKIAILFAGPLVNFILAIAILWAINLQGINTLKPIIGEVIKDSIADKHGFKKDMEIVSINNNDIITWEDAYLSIIEHLGTDNTLTILVKNLGSDDVIQKHLSVTGLDLPETDNFFESLGIQPIDPIPPVVGSLVPDHPAEEAGIIEKDKILSVDGLVVKNRFEVIKYVKENYDKKLNFVVLRNDKQISFNVMPKIKQVEGKQVGIVGIVFANVEVPDYFKVVKPIGVFDGLKLACEKVKYYSVLTLKMIVRMITGDISVKHLTGPVSIASHAGQAVDYGITVYFNFLALISISLGVLNLLPVPVLDGGQIVFCFYELIFKKPISDNVKNILNVIGIFIIIMLTALALTNDFSRLMS